MKALVFGDVHSDIEKVRELAGKTRNFGIRLVLILGDFTNEGTLSICRKTVSLIKECFPEARIFALPGNQDSREIIEFLESEKISLHKKCVEFNGFEFLGIGGGKPVHCFYRINVGELEAKKFFSQNYPSSGKPVVVLSHTPPSGTTTLELAENGAKLGLNALRDLIVEKQPLLVLCGHVHEAFGEERIGRTICVNTGSLKDGGHALLLELSENPRIEWLKV